MLSLITKNSADKIKKIKKKTNSKLNVKIIKNIGFLFAFWPLNSGKFYWFRIKSDSGKFDLKINNENTKKEKGIQQTKTVTSENGFLFK
jgi:hypothetical protein